ncbi:hypothetical protein VKT23_009321 [Stygiomarasmius scandens]|uniref:Uncharacterized protein n=1 Tax=Marasmiellus scandens TaxID=2682957 RepID=A0ABR1JF28_9AGAR
MPSAYDYDSANDLLKSLVSRYTDSGLGTMSGSIYDTAWVSLVSRTIDGVANWVFPESFQFIYASQADDGSWNGDGSVVDAVMNGLVCLLSFKRHLRPSSDHYLDLPQRIDKAIAYLNDVLQIWDVNSTERIAFEMIIPCILELLEKEGVNFDFPQRELLYKVYTHKLKKVDFEVVYSHHTTVLHSLEAFIGRIDFDRLAHHKRGGSFMASPSSTAAYLMSTSTWDNEAEQYLRHVVDQCKVYGHGSVCNVWPTTVFEFSWTVCNLFESGFEHGKLDKPSLERIGNILHSALTAEKGIIGFAPNVGPDADDTAKAITALQYIGTPFPLDRLLEAFELPAHFQCFQYERNPSLSANCNVLIALLQYPNSSKYTSQIVKAATFITEEYWTTEGIVRDKWHLSPWYVGLLAVQGLVRFIHLHGRGLYGDAVSEDLLTLKTPIALFQILLRIMQSQNEDGSWGTRNPNVEETAYCVLALAQLASLPYHALLRDQIDTSVAAGRRYIQANISQSSYIEPDSYIWVGKVAYGIEHVCRGYVISALNAPVPTYSPESVSSGAPPIPVKRVEYFTNFYFQLPMFSHFTESKWRLRAWLIEGYLFLPALARARLDVFDRIDMKGDAYFEYLPFSWTGPNGMEETYASPQTVFDMIVISMVNFQADEFFDLIIQKYGAEGLKSVREVVKQIFNESSPGSPVVGYKPLSATNGALDGHSSVYAEIHSRLAHFVNFIFTYPRIVKASPNDKLQLKCEMQIYLNAHIDQCEDNVRLQAQESADLYLTPRSSYLKWVRTTASDHLSSQYSFAFMTCLLGHSANLKEVEREEDYFPGSLIKYIAQDCCTHLSVICRIYNDYGSLKRDKAEKNLNATFFPEFEGKAKNKSDLELKRELAIICDYERKCLKLALDGLLHRAQSQLGETRGKRVHEVMRLFYNASEIYTEVYELRDISTGN